ncbi:MAG: four helix bundle protein [Bdellovibrionales bacterium]|nr:four helix bundle protein [Bdellovibrionales bacterium]
MQQFRTYQLALELAKLCRQIKLKGPYKNQFDRAVLSIALNLSEGSSRESKRDRRRFYEIALGSIRETQTLIEILDLKEIRKLTDQLAASAYCLCRSLRDEGVP